MKREAVILAPGKVNLHLEVLGKRQDGFHDIVSLFQAVDLCDRLTIRSLTDSSECVIHGMENIPTRKNSIYQAARLFAGKCGLKTGVKISVEKRIPIGAGLGGGSSDVAGVLTGLNALFDYPLTETELAELGEQVGSDVPFFLLASTALVTGRGECVQPVEGRTDYSLVLVFPGFPLSTPSAYRALSRLPGETVSTRLNPIEVLRYYASAHPLEWPFFNSFTDHLVSRYSSIKDLLIRLKNCGALYTAISGSGSSVFGIFPNYSVAGKASGKLKSEYPSIWTINPLDRWMYPLLQ